MLHVRVVLIKCLKLFLMDNSVKWMPLELWWQTPSQSFFLLVLVMCKRTQVLLVNKSITGWGPTYCHDFNNPILSSTSILILKDYYGARKHMKTSNVCNAFLLLKLFIIPLSWIREVAGCLAHFSKIVFLPLFEASGL